MQKGRIKIKPNGASKEAYMRSKIHTLKTNANPAATKSKRKKHKLAKTESKQMENTGCEVLTDSIKTQLRELEYDYIKEFKKRCMLRKVERILMN